MKCVGTLDGAAQILYFGPDDPCGPEGLFKGMRWLIKERIERGADLPNPDMLKAQCKNFKCQTERRNCCCRNILFYQPDFAGAKSVLEEFCATRGYRVLFSPKFHCELSMIEPCWGYAKRLYREYPVSSDAATLEHNVLTALNAVPLHSMRRFVVCQS